jgi:beta-1,4-mannosyl-glycoprotein beta-1,4-N-acetylglucosaminyltransferase
MTYDCFIFFNELDLLEIRLNVLDKVVDKFVLVEATRTHAGKDKPLYFDQNKKRFSQFLPKIDHIVVDDFPPFETTWTYENHQRNCIVRGLKNVRLSDTIIISDLDEIPNPNLVMQFKGSKGIKLFELSFYYYYMNYSCVTLPVWRGGSKMLSYETFLGFDEKYKSVYGEYLLESVNKGPTMTKVRCFDGADIVIPKAGWHFSYLGGMKSVLEKLRSFAHQEYGGGGNFNEDVVARRMKQGLDPFRGTEHFYGVQIDEHYPQYIKENQEKYQHLVFTITPEYIRKTWLMRRYYYAKGWVVRFIVFRVFPRSWHPFLIRIRNLLWFGQTSVPRPDVEIDTSKR